MPDIPSDTIYNNLNQCFNYIKSDRAVRAGRPADQMARFANRYGASRVGGCMTGEFQTPSYKRSS